MISSALIVGGGPAGLTAAIALARRGIEVELRERQTDWAPAGIGLLVQSPPLRAMRSLGLMDAVVAAGYAHHEIDVTTPDGDVVAVLPLMQVNEPGDPPAVALARTTLHEILVAAAREAGVGVHLGSTLESPDDTDADLIVVADGTHSATRARVLGGEPLAPRADGQLIWRAAAARPPQLTRYTMVNGPFGHLGLVPLSDELLYLWLLQRDGGGPRPTAGERGAVLRAQLAGVGGHVPAVLDALDAEVEIDVRSIAHLLVPLPWRHGRALLIGDAAHTTTPHLAFGVGMAIEDAVVLAELAAEHDDVAALGEAFSARRYERCRFVVESSAQIAAWQTQTPPDVAAIQGRMGEAQARLAQPY